MSSDANEVNTRAQRAGEPASAPDPSTAPEPRAEELEALQRELAAANDRNLRLLADMRNQQQRGLREQAQTIRYAEADFARALLVIVDDLERILARSEVGSDLASVLEGVRIAYEHFLKVLRVRNVEPIPALGEKFDPERHEALMQQPSTEYPAGTVMQELARGYRMHERVLRPARVVVSTGPSEPAAEAGPPST